VDSQRGEAIWLNRGGPELAAALDETELTEVGVTTVGPAQGLTTDDVFSAMANENKCKATSAAIISHRPGRRMGIHARNSLAYVAAPPARAPTCRSRSDLR